MTSYRLLNMIPLLNDPDTRGRRYHSRLRVLQAKLDECLAMGPVASYWGLQYSLAIMKLKDEYSGVYETLRGHMPQSQLVKSINKRRGEKRLWMWLLLWL